jgi:hypothetical protein
MEAICFSETLVSTDESIQRQNPEHHHQLHAKFSNLLHTIPTSLIQLYFKLETGPADCARPWNDLNWRNTEWDDKSLTMRGFNKERLIPRGASTAIGHYCERDSDSQLVSTKDGGREGGGVIPAPLTT